MRRALQRPFTGSVVTDAPAYLLGDRDKPFAQDGHSPQGLFRSRRGWAYDGTTADGPYNLKSVGRWQFILVDETRTATFDEEGIFYVHNPSSSGTGVGGPAFSNTYELLPRCVYRDEVIWCNQQPGNPIWRWAGASAGGTFPSGTPTLTDGEATITGGTFGVAPTVGQFFRIYSQGSNNRVEIFPRIINSSTTSVTLEGIRSGSTQTIDNSLNVTGSFAYSYPSVAIDSAGTATSSSNTVTGYGTEWLTSIGPAAERRVAILLVPPSGVAQHGQVVDVTANTSLVAAVTNQATKSQAIITDRCPFKDAAAHQGSFWGTGVQQFPSRVYVGPPGWNLTFPPGYIEPVDPAGDYSSSNANDFLMDFIDVPSSYDGDDNVAILTSPGPLLVLKRNSVYGISGSFPSFSVDLIADGIGCIDIRSAQSFDEGQFFAGENGIYWYTGGRFVDLTAGKINREWRDLTRQFDYGVNDYCSIGIASGHLFVHITTAGGTIQRTYVCDLRDQTWQSRFTNISPRYMFTSRVPGEKEKLFAVQDIDQGRVIDLAPCVDGSGVAKDGDGTSPNLQAWTPENLDGRGMDEDTRLLDLAIHANVYDAGAAGSTSMAVSVVSQDALTGAATSTKTLADIDSDAVDRVDRHYYRRVDRRGRRHQVRLDVDTVGTNDANTKVEVAEIVASFRDSRQRS